MGSVIKIVIDGEATRNAVTEMTGKANGVTALCEKLGIENSLAVMVNKSCRRGWISAEYIPVLVSKGFPIQFSDKPVLSRRHSEHTRNNKSEMPVKASAPEQITLSDVEKYIIPTDIPDDMALPYQMKTLIISHLTDLIEDLKKL